MIDLFVPGRLCLFGEHSDWAGEYRSIDSSVETGQCVITGTDQGIFGSAELASDGLHVTQVLPDGSTGSVQRYPGDPDRLEEAARAGLFDSYAAGTASVVMRKYSVSGLRLTIHKRTLPLKKGLSSSAAVCVLTARAFSKVYRLNLSVHEEMELAYRGELLTGSQCGRMDQACALGGGSALLSFDGDEFSVKPLFPGKPLFLLIIDLHSAKNTRRILKELYASFSGGNRQIRDALGRENHRITFEACRAIEAGNSQRIGELMTEAQRVFDEMVAPCCLSELKAEKLHSVLGCSAAKTYSWGGKGVGSQGDGTAQFICKGISERNRLRDLLESEQNVTCYNLTM